MSFLLSYTMLVIVLFLLCIGSFVNADTVTLGITRPCIEKERQALLLVKGKLVGAHNSLGDWGGEEEKKDCCKWVGVSCDNHTGHVIGLDLSNSSYHLVGNISTSLHVLHRLEYLNLSGIDLQSNPTPNFLGSLTRLRRVDISAANLSGPIPRHLSNLSNLLHLDLSRNSLTGSIPFSFGDFTSITYLDLSRNQLEGVIPKSFENSSSLVQLNLSENLLNGTLPSFARCPNLKELVLHRNNLYGVVPYFKGCSSLSELSLAYNYLTGTIPDFRECQSLRKIDLSSNRLSGNLPNSIGQLSNLKFLDVSSNFLEGAVSDVHFLNLTQLKYLDLSFNSLALELSSRAKILFQLKTINLQSCKLGPSFPLWLKTQRNFTHVDISSAGISDTIPAWFWDLPLGLKFLNLSSNEMKGMLPDMQLHFNGYPGMDLSRNHLEGRIPLLPSKLAALNLSQNKFSGTLSFMCQIGSALTFLDLSHNSLSGTLPDCWLKFQKQLVVLNLCNNNLSGKISSSLGSLHQLEALYLRGNAFVGELPMSLSNLTKLRLLDVGDNKLSGKFPLTFGERLSELYVLILRSNRFYGSLPSQICWLNNLNFLDVSNNGFSGNIPPCFGNFTAMARIGVRDYITSRTYSSYKRSFLPDDLVPRAISYAPSGRIPDPCLRKGASSYNCRAYGNNLRSGEVLRGSEKALSIDKTWFVWKGKDRAFERGLQLLISIDLSSNNLSGKLPNDITSLRELVSLNVSYNKLHGEIPKDIGQLKLLQSLDLSRNEFYGTIPTSLSQLTFLGYLDLSNNDLSGRIPSGPQLQLFDFSFYSGNPQLCGPPLTKRCAFPPATTVEKEDDEDADDLWKSDFTSLGAGFAVGFWGICGTLLFNRRSRNFLFASLSQFKDWMYVTVVVQSRKLQREIRRKLNISIHSAIVSS